jgi:uncharacterized protein
VSITVDVRDLLGRPGSSRRVHLHTGMAGLATELARVREDTGLDVDLLLESVVEGILASGAVSGVTVLTCARCLTDVEQPLAVSVQELFVPGAAPDELDAYPVVDGEIDLEPVLRDAVVLALPYSPLCRPDCLGICERCGGNRNFGECTCLPEPDERWAPLAGLRLPER